MMGHSQADKDKAEREHTEAMARLRQRNARVLYDWRRGKLEAAGFDRDQAELLLDWRVDSTEAADLLKRGCPVPHAMEIMRPLEMPHWEEAV